LLSGLAAIYFAYPPECSFHPGETGTSREASSTTPFSLAKKSGPKGTIAQVGKITQGNMRKKSGKNEVFFKRLWIFQPKTAISRLYYPGFSSSPQKYAKERRQTLASMASSGRLAFR
jgi:hypothetical protein